MKNNFDETYIDVLVHLVKRSIPDEIVLQVLDEEGLGYINKLFKLE